MKKLILLFLGILVFLAPVSNVQAISIENCDSGTIECWCNPGLTPIDLYNEYYFNPQTPEMCNNYCGIARNYGANVDNFSLVCTSRGEEKVIDQKTYTDPINLNPADIKSNIITPEVEQKEFLVPTIGVEIPGFQEKVDAEIKTARVQGTQPNLLGIYVSSVYSLLLILSSVIAILVLMIGGVQYMLARGDSGAISKAKTRIQDALIGLVMVFSAYTILYFIDPSLTEFEPLHPETIEKIETSAGDETGDYTPRTDIGGQNIKITGDHIIPTNILINENVLPNLQMAADDFYASTGLNLRITSGFRDARKQVELLYDNCISQTNGHCRSGTCNLVKNDSSLLQVENRKYTLTGELTGETDKDTIVNKLLQDIDVTKCPHNAGVAIDLWPEIHNGIGGGFTAKIEEMDKLTEAMTSNGFCRIGSEAWHFELNKYRISKSSCLTTYKNSTYKYSGMSYPNSDTCSVWKYANNNSGKGHQCIKLK